MAQPPTRPGVVRRAESTSPTLADLAEIRGATYDLFGSLFLSPGGEGGLEQAGETASWLRGRSDLVRSFPFFPSWRAVLDSAGSLQDERARLEEEHVQLFQLGGSSALCPPYESAFLDPSGFERGLLTVDVEQAYRKAGAALAGTGELPDHVSLELGFMAFLCGEEAKAWEAAERERAVTRLGEQAGFLDRHLLLWFPAFARRLGQATAETSFYGRLAGAVRRFLVHDRDLAGALLEDPAAAPGES